MTDLCYPSTPRPAAWLPTFRAVGQLDRNSLAHAVKCLLNIDHSKQMLVYAHTNANWMVGTVTHTYLPKPPSFMLNHRDLAVGIYTSALLSYP